MPQRMVRLDGGRGEPTSQPPTLPTKPPESLKPGTQGLGTYCEHP
jgi:hypothetical protein